MFDLSALDSYQEISWVSWETPGQIVISFHTIDPVKGMVTNLYMYMLDASISDINLRCAPYFPLFCGVQQKVIADNPEGFRGLLTFSFEEGGFSIFCREVFFHEIATPAEVLSRSENG
jgi:hypothetical protein